MATTSFSGDRAPTEGMDAFEARTLADEIKFHLDKADEKLIQLHDRGGWRALKYESWSDCCIHEFNMTRQRGYQLLALARLRLELRELPEDVSTNRRHLKPVNEYQARELYKLETPNERVTIYAEAVRETNGKVTARVLKKLVDAHKGISQTIAQAAHAKPRPSPTLPTAPDWREKAYPAVNYLAPLVDDKTLWRVFRMMLKAAYPKLQIGMKTE